MGAVNNKYIFSGKTFQCYHSVERKISWFFIFFFWVILFNKWNIWWMLSPRKLPCPKKLLVARLFLFFFQICLNPWLFLLFTELIILPIFALSYTLTAFPLCNVTTITSKQLSTKCCSNVIVLLCAAEKERVQSLMD